jgi:hypothetical protein
MNTARKTQGIAIVAFMMLLLALGAGVRAASTSSTTSTTSATTSESTETQNQFGTNETQGSNHQEGANQTDGDNVNVVEVDQGEQDQITNAEDNQDIAGEVQVNDTSASASVTDSRFSLVPTVQSDHGLNVRISADNVAGPKSFAVRLSGSMDPTSHTLLVTLDGKRIAQASSLSQVLKPSSADPARYMVVKTSSGYELLASVPHFSTHTLAITPFALGPLQGFFPISGTALAAALVAITAIFAVVFATRTRIYNLLS